MPTATVYRYGFVDAVASQAVETVDVACPPNKAIVVVFDPGDPPARCTLYSNAGATDLVPVLRAVLARIEAGTLRMPVVADTVRWEHIQGEGDADDT